MAVMAVTAGGLALSAGAAERHRLNNASLALQADLRYAQRMALIEGRRWGIIFDIKRNQYELFSITADGKRQAERTVALPDGVALYHTNAHENQVVYLPRGTVSQGFSVMLLKDRYWQRLTATVSGGRIEIKPVQLTRGGVIPLN